MFKQTHVARNFITVLLITLLIISVLPVSVFSLEESSTEPAFVNEPSSSPEEPSLPGTTKGTGTDFSIKDSEYLNVSLNSSQSIKLNMQSSPEMVTIEVEPATEATSTELTLSGFAPLATYHKYEDDLHNHTEFTTDENGKYTFTQDINQKHTVIIQPRPSTIFLNDVTGWSKPVGTWDPVTKTATLTQDINESIQIDSNNITLDGNNHISTGTGTSSGVYLPSARTGVTIKNLTIKKYNVGIWLNSASGNNLHNNSLSQNSTGISLSYAQNSTLTNNTIIGGSAGIYMRYSGNSTLRANNISVNGWNLYIFGNSDLDYDNDIDTTNLVNSKKVYYLNNQADQTIDSSSNAGLVYLINSNNITVRDLDLERSNASVFLYKTNNSRIDNVISYATQGVTGIHAQNSNSNTITNNLSRYGQTGIFLDNSSQNIVTNNTATGNMMGIRVTGGSSNTVSSNTLSKNKDGIRLDGSSNNNNISSNNVSLNEYTSYSVSGSPDNTLVGNITSSGGLGFYIENSGGTTMTGNTVLDNKQNFALIGTTDAHYDNDIDTTNLLDGKPIYYLNNQTNQTIDSSSNAGVVYLINSNNITVKDIFLTKNYMGIYLHKTQNSIIENVTTDKNSYNMYLYYSNTNTLKANTLLDSSGIGMFLMNSDNNNVESNSSSKVIFIYNSNYNLIKRNTISGGTNNCIRLQNSNFNKIYNNNFMSYSSAINGYGSGNVFNLPAPIGGNYYSTWNTPDVNSDGFVDNPYVFTGGQDNLPWTIENGWGTNQAPVADAGAPYSADEASSITFNGSASTDSDGSITSYEWDLDNDGAYDDATGINASKTWADDYVGTVGLRVTDDQGAQSTDTAQISVNNLAPTVNTATVDQPNPLIILPGNPLTFNGSFSDVGYLDTHTANWDFGDGSTSTGSLTEENTSPDSTGTATETHSYADPGTYTATLTITDDDGSVGQKTVTTTVSNPSDGVGTLNNYIYSLPDSAFVSNSYQRKSTFNNKLTVIQSLIASGDYTSAINKLENDIIKKLDGFLDESSDLDWIVDVDAQKDLYYSSKALVDYLQTLL